MLRRIELTFDIEGNHIKILGWQEIGGQNPSTGVTPIHTAADGNLASPPPQPPTESPAAAQSKKPTRASPRDTQPPSIPSQTKAALPWQLGRQIQDEIARDNQRIGIHLISRITQGMLTDPTGVLAKIRADQIFGMLELAELLDLNDDMCEFLENHHAAILRGLR